MRLNKFLSSFFKLIFILFITFTLSLKTIFASNIITDEQIRLNIGYCPYGMLQTAVMKEKMFYKKYAPNLEINWYFGKYSFELIDAWITGKINFAYLGNMPAIMLEARQDTNTTWVGNACSNGGEVGQVFVPEDSPAKSIKDLNGKIIATGFASSHHRILEVIQDQEDIIMHVANIDPELLITNYEAGKCKYDGSLYWPPYIDYFLDKNIGRPIQNCTKYEPEINSIWPIVVSDHFLQKKPGIVKAFVKADQDLHDFMKNNPREAAEIVYRALDEKFPFEVILNSLARYKYSDVISKKEIQIMQRDIDWMKKKGFIKNEFYAVKWADPQFSKQIEPGTGHDLN